MSHLDSPGRTRRTRSDGKTSTTKKAGKALVGAVERDRVAPSRARIADYMTPDPVTIGLAQPLALAHEMMRRRRIRHLPVLDNGELLGIVSLGNLHLVETLAGTDPGTATVEEAMTPDPYTVGPDAPLAEVAKEMADHRYGCAMIVDGRRLVGMFTTVDALRAIGTLVA